MIVIGISITRNNIYGIKTDIKSEEFDTSLGHGLAEKIIKENILTGSVIMNKLPGKSIRDIAKILMVDGILPDKISIACFGPFSSLDKSEDGPDRYYGQISADAHFTDFKGISLKKQFGQAFRKYKVYDAKIFVQTDVAASGVAEWSYRGSNSVRCEREKIDIINENLVFLKFCGGIGGVSIDKSGRPINGVLHPEMGQIAVEKHPSDIEAKFKGLCPHHDDCLEGMACEEAFFSRFGSNANSFKDISEDTKNKAWDIQAFYIAQLCVAVTLMFSPTMIVLGGDVFREKFFLSRVRRYFLKRLGGVDSRAFAWYPLLERNDGFLQTPVLSEPGVIGAACIPAMEGTVVSIGNCNG